METTSTSVNRGMDRDVAYVHNGILLREKRNEITPFAA